MLTDPNVIFPGRLVFVAPHMDDEVLACGGTIARLDDPARAHCVFATDGSQSPVPLFPWIGHPPENLTDVRIAEAVAALAELGVPETNLTFLDLPDGALNRHEEILQSRLRDTLSRLSPDIVFIPFRFDRHPDHLAVHRAVTGLVDDQAEAPRIVEYFVYYRWKLIPGGDIRKLIHPNRLIEIDITSREDVKLAALKRYESQTTLIADWQTRPILPPDRIRAVSGSPELFHWFDPNDDVADTFYRLNRWIPIAHKLEPVLKMQKDRILTLLRVRNLDTAG